MLTDWRFFDVLGFVATLLYLCEYVNKFYTVWTYHLKDNLNQRFYPR